MKYKLLSLEILGAFFVIIIGAVFHFIFEWSNQWLPLGAIAPVNESVWEHLKLVFWPLIFFSIIEYFPIKNEANNFLLSKLVAIVIAEITILVTFYSYTAVLGTEILLVDILSFIIGVILGYIASYRILKLKTAPNWSMIASFATIILLGIIFVVFTYFPPEIPLFEDPETGMYGIISNL
ncbi:MAG: DUF6512 family protein [Candidatus Heimdallarchaeota archaeon]